MKVRENTSVKKGRRSASYGSAELSQREIEVLSLSAKGKIAEEISLILHISEDTVKDHLERVRKKLDTVNKTHSVAVAISRGIIKP